MEGNHLNELFRAFCNHFRSHVQVGGRRRYRLRHRTLVLPQCMYRRTSLLNCVMQEAKPVQGLPKSTIQRFGYPIVSGTSQLCLAKLCVHFAADEFRCDNHADEPLLDLNTRLLLSKREYSSYRNNWYLHLLWRYRNDSHRQFHAR